MVNLTLIRYADISASGCILLKDALRLFTLAKLVSDAFGKPGKLYAADVNESIQSAQIVNLVCSTFCISADKALTSNASAGDIAVFINQITSTAKQERITHIVLICSEQTLNSILSGNFHFGNSYTLCAGSWDDIISSYDLIWSPFKQPTDTQASIRYVTGETSGKFYTPENIPLIQRMLDAFVAT